MQLLNTLSHRLLCKLKVLQAELQNLECGSTVLRDPACVSLSVYVCISDFFYVLENFTGGVTSIARQSST